MQQQPVAFLFSRNKRLQVPVGRKPSAGIPCERGCGRKTLLGRSAGASAISRGVPKVARHNCTKLILQTATPFKFRPFFQADEIMPYLNIPFSFSRFSLEHLQLCLLNQSAAGFLSVCVVPAQWMVTLSLRCKSLVFSITKGGEWLNSPASNEGLTVVFSVHYICIYRLIKCIRAGRRARTSSKTISWISNSE